MKNFDKYAWYQASVQNPAADIRFIQNTYKELRRRNPKVLREDFCGTFSNSCHWVGRGADHIALGVDIDSEPLSWGERHNLSKLPPSSHHRVKLYRKSVTQTGIPKSDVTYALNFSYFIFKQREEMRHYLSQARKGLNKDGLLILDSMGGTDCQIPCEEIRNYPDFRYIWELESYDPISNNGKFAIHFKPKRAAKIKSRVFTYDWRMWSIVEIRELMAEVGFSRSLVYWEGTSRKGEGNGKFRQRERGEACETWIAYIVGVK